MRRYVEEWLKGMTCAKYLEFDPIGETYRLPDEHAFLLASDDTDHFMGGLFSIVPVLLRVAPDVATAFAQGGGVRFEEFGSEGVVGLDLINRGQYEQRLTSYWLKALPMVTARLEAGARVLDVGCGAGRVCIAIAKDFPQTRVVGLDPDAESIRHAEAAAAAAGVSGRITFLAATIDDLDAGDPFDLITACDCIHDFATPQRTLEQIRALLKPRRYGVYCGAQGRRPARGQHQFDRYHVLRLQPFSLHDAVARQRRPWARYLPRPSPHAGARPWRWFRKLRTDRHQEPREPVLRRKAMILAAKSVESVPPYETAMSEFGAKPKQRRVCGLPLVATPRGWTRLCRHFVLTPVLSRRDKTEWRPRCATALPINRLSVPSNRFAYTGEGAGSRLLVFEPHPARDLDALCLGRAGAVQAFGQIADSIAADRHVLD
jgi:SAM-dependent methyltransferase